MNAYRADGMATKLEIMHGAFITFQKGRFPSYVQLVNKVTSKKEIKNKIELSKAKKISSERYIIPAGNDENVYRVAKKHVQRTPRTTQKILALVHCFFVTVHT